MNMWTKTAAGAVLGGSLLVAGGFGLASAAPDAPQLPQAPQPVAGGELNVGLTVNGEQLGTIQNVSLSSAQTLATSVCPSDDLSSKLPQLASNQVESVPVCASSTTGVSYTFTQAGPGNSDIVPQSHGASGIGSTATSTAPATAPGAAPSAELPMTGSR
ncbi:hypothetical protein FHT40_001881 [Mycolicibacterium sp. BK556]|uniref:hypothetical protein n=1 Tax=Mycobacteriaceae TaxID=1762 RepID=UPI0010617BA9|nr:MULTISPECIES: hypothetical protein [Mycobacteriaceae]MBB3602248.1 hypothetical protein [Mycolicibacterium sp. BK556]MBB3632000.1 hypothetical protein [Mycolicibacterium sp. BK607]MBB3750018.1 hypothetical protein [Mycolicibacterium sp. BK634]TDO18709.1 hypothetical protein EV580_1897 [Mycobacterium sp. BK086]